MTMNKRFTIEKSTILNGAKFINDKNNEFTFSTTEEIRSLITYEKALNKLNDENRLLKEQLDEMIQIFEDSGLDYFIGDELEEILE